MNTRNAFVASFVVLLLVPAGSRAGDSEAKAQAKQFRREARALERKYHHVDLLVRDDLQMVRKTASNVVVSETVEGRRWAHADSHTMFESLSIVSIASLRLRKRGLLLLELQPASHVRPRLAHPRGEPGWHEGALISRSPSAVWGYVELNPLAAGGVEDALATVLYLNGAMPEAQELERCLVRYTDHDGELSRQRCNARLVAGETEGYRLSNPWQRKRGDE